MTTRRGGHTEHRVHLEALVAKPFGNESMMMNRVAYRKFKFAAKAGGKLKPWNGFGYDLNRCGVVNCDEIPTRFDQRSKRSNGSTPVVLDRLVANPCRMIDTPGLNAVKKSLNELNVVAKMGAEAAVTSVRLRERFIIKATDHGNGRFQLAAESRKQES